METISPSSFPVCLDPTCCGNRWLCEGCKEAARLPCEPPCEFMKKCRSCAARQRRENALGPMAPKPNVKTTKAKERIVAEPLKGNGQPQYTPISPQPAEEKNRQGEHNGVIHDEPDWYKGERAKELAERQATEDPLPNGAPEEK